MWRTHIIWQPHDFTLFESDVWKKMCIFVNFKGLWKIRILHVNNAYRTRIAPVSHPYHTRTEPVPRKRDGIARKRAVNMRNLIRIITCNFRISLYFGSCGLMTIYDDWCLFGTCFPCFYSCCLWFLSTDPALPQKLPAYRSIQLQTCCVGG